MSQWVISSDYADHIEVSAEEALEKVLELFDAGFTIRPHACMAPEVNDHHHLILTRGQEQWGIWERLEKA